tara:strand:+ start:692 stop:1033 length:342 start_codon:yes stop_codon:yes gene_type:complete
MIFVEELCRVNAGIASALMIQGGITSEIIAQYGSPKQQEPFLRAEAVIARAAGLVGHIREERAHPAGMHVWKDAEENVPYARRSAVYGVMWIWHHYKSTRSAADAVPPRTGHE